MSAHETLLSELRGLSAALVARIKQGRATVKDVADLAEARQQLIDSHDLDLEREPATAHEAGLAKQLERLDAEIHRFCFARQAEVTRALILRPKTPKRAARPRILSQLA